MEKAEFKKYLKYYFLEDYLFKEISRNFSENHKLEKEEFFAIVIWKSNRAKTGVKNGIKKQNLNVSKLTSDLDEKSPEEKLKLLDDVPGIGIPIASAILAVCYPNDFTIADYRAFNSFIKLLYEKRFADIKKKLSPTLTKYIAKYLKRRKEINIYNAIHKTKLKSNHINDITSEIYFEYLKACKVLSKKLNFTLRDFDRMLFGMDFYEGKNGLRDLVRNLQ